ncbi:molybdate ABC transporter substrate-binding protein [uncultured Paraglaciecola sp.]|uniref:molybdate ABC transporter substrate-binding protein n=1 Tax=uncultured Paraglaciecola sp. TaxID=1765024 RepID=UPI002628CBA2|nr:molybdate ABC transporter substrate-binding protein [uncultured Paraglaciecola sp.]
MKIRNWLGALILSGAALNLEAKTVHIAVAANFNKTMQSLVTAFEKTSEYRIVMSVGSSGKFYAQLKHGAPYELFFSADQAKPAALQRDGLVSRGSRFTYAIGRLALWSAHPDFLNKIEQKLQQGAFNKLALANPKLAPYGEAAVAVLDNLGLTTATQANWVIGENVAQSYQFVDSGNADLGFVALSQLLGAKRVPQGAYWIVPIAMHPAIKQDVVVLKRAAQSQGAKAFLDFLHSTKAAAIIAEYGYLVANTMKKEPD